MTYGTVELDQIYHTFLILEQIIEKVKNGWKFGEKLMKGNEISLHGTFANFYVIHSYCFKGLDIYRYRVKLVKFL